MVVRKYTNEEPHNTKVHGDRSPNLFIPDDEGTLTREQYHKIMKEMTKDGSNKK